MSYTFSANGVMRFIAEEVFMSRIMRDYLDFFNGNGIYSREEL